MHRLAPDPGRPRWATPIRSCAAPRPLIVETLRQEEERFRRTLGRGMALLDEATAGLTTGDVLSGETAFKLYDTYGFPLDLTQDAVRATGHHRRHRRLRRGDGPPAHAWRARAGPARASRPQGAVWLALRDRLGPTVFTGYDERRDHRPSCWPWSSDGAEVDAAEAGETRRRRCSTARPSTPRAAARPATGARSTGRAAAAEVVDTQKEAGDLHVHALKITEGALRARRRACAWRSTPSGAPRTRLNHSAAHLVHAALQPRAGPARGPEGPAGRRRSHALRLQPRRAADAGRDRRASRPRSTR